MYSQFYSQTAETGGSQYRLVKHIQMKSEHFYMQLITVYLKALC